MQRLLFLTLFFTGSAVSCLAQENTPVEWHFSAKKVSPNTYEIHCTASIEDPWHIYSQNSESAITQPTVISFRSNPLLALDKTPPREKGEIIEEQQKAVRATMRYYKNEVDFIKTVTLKSHVRTSVAGAITYMACTDEKCMPPVTTHFAIPLKIQ